MVAGKSTDKRQYGDFQTPIGLARKVVGVLKRNHRIDPDVIVEPTCGKGSFVIASYEGFKRVDIVGFDINAGHVRETKLSLKKASAKDRVTVNQGDFFHLDWKKILSELRGHVLIIGNPPWVTNCELSALNSQNLPEKSNFQNRTGIESITGSANFDISEWMLLQHVDWLSKREGTIAFLCKYAVARKVLRQVGRRKKRRFVGHVYLIDAKAHFNASVEACLFVLTTHSGNADCEVYDSLDSARPSHRIGERDGFIISNIDYYEKWRHFRGADPRYIWRSGIKHDCSKIMELEPLGDGYKNGLGEIVECEDKCIYPLLKGSDVGNGRTGSCRKAVLVTQKAVGENTSQIRNIAPNAWKYLVNNREHLDGRKSAIYKNKPDFSLFGVGPYTFSPWKIAIAGLYKKLNYNLVGPLNGKAVVFDDTVNFLSFDSQGEAGFIFHLLTSDPAREFIEAMIFWDEKRPITAEVLRRLSLKEVARELGYLAQYRSWAEKSSSGVVGQMSIELAEGQSEYKAG